MDKAACTWDDRKTGGAKISDQPKNKQDHNQQFKHNPSPKFALKLFPRAGLLKRGSQNSQSRDAFGALNTKTLIFFSCYGPLSIFSKIIFSGKDQPIK
jgi:hypothetical protein